jgi:autoinducer 2-degrading protein
MLSVLVTLRVKPGHIQEFLAAIALNAEASLRDEPGCLAFAVHQSREDPFTYLLYEIYRDDDAFSLDHKAAPHYTAWQAAAARCLEPGGRTNTYYTPVGLEQSIDSSAQLTPTAQEAQP